MTEKKNNSKGTIVGLSIVIVVLIGYIVYMHFNTNRLVAEKVKIEVEHNDDAVNWFQFATVKVITRLLLQQLAQKPCWAIQLLRLTQMMNVIHT